jgi:glycosyltransferase involved in cell wall biosynthesis
MKFTILLPVYGESPWIHEALQSVTEQSIKDWKLVIADDGSDEETQSWLMEKLTELNDSRITWTKRPHNLGLFRNLNQAINETNSDWILLLCSDDRFKINAIDDLVKLHNKWPQAGLILSTFESINADGSKRDDDSAKHHDQLRKNTGLVQPESMVPSLLQLGSLNGNLTGMAFSKELWREAGPFREDWRHAADWEWLVRACELKALLLNRKPIASVRTHESQLSNHNRKSGHELIEIGEIVKSLMNHKLLDKEPKKKEWADHVMQHQLWNLIKIAPAKSLRNSIKDLSTIHETVGLRNAIISMLKYIPARVEKRLSELRKGRAH